MSCIKRLTAEHVAQYRDELRLLLKYCMENGFSTSFSDEFYDEKLSALQSYLTEGRACLLGAVKDNHLQGILWGYPMDTLLGRNFHIAYIAVFPRYRGEGIGSQLLCTAEELAKEMGLLEMELLVSSENHHAFELYKKQNYTTSRLTMRKQLAGD